MERNEREEAMIREMNLARAKTEEIDRQVYRSQCRIKCLESMLTRIDCIRCPEDFEAVVRNIEAEKARIKSFADARLEAHWKWKNLDYKLTRGYVV